MQRDAKKKPPKGRLQLGRWIRRLEEDHATNLEDIETFPAGAEVLAEVLVHNNSALVADPEGTKVGRTQVEIKILGKTHKAIVIQESPFDTENERLKA